MHNIKLKLKYLSFYILLFTFTIAICFFSLEMFGRFYYSNLTEIANKMFDPTLGWRLKPGQYLIKPSHTLKKHYIHINDLGLRNRNISSSLIKDKKRILILGDSFTYASCVREEIIFSTQLEKIINKIYENKYEIINSGVPGYGTAQELLMMKYLSHNSITCDVYLLMIFTNDILDNLRLQYGSLHENFAQPGFVISNEGTLELKHLPQKKVSHLSENFVPVKKTSKKIKITEILKTKIQSFLQTKPDLIRILNKFGIDAKFPRMPGVLNGWYMEDVLDIGVPLLEALIKEIKYEANKSGAKVLIGIIPSSIQVYPDSYGQLLKRTFPNNPQIQTFLEDITRPQDIIIRICQKSKIPYLDLYPIFYENNDKEMFIPGDGHFNDTGHTIAAHSLAEFIIQNIENDFST